MKLKLVSIFALVSCIEMVHGQVLRDPLQGYTPPQMTQGSPEGSFPLSGFDTIAPANRNLNFVLNLHTVKGRGAVSVPVNLSLGVLWNIRSNVSCIQTNQQNGCIQYKSSFFPTASWWNEGSSQFLRYQPAWVRLRQNGDQPALVGNSPNPAPQYYAQRTNSQITAVLPDRTEMNFRDVLTNGKYDLTYDNPFANGIPSGYNRGAAYTSVDGQGASFYSDYSIPDRTLLPYGGANEVSGWMYLRDGTRLRIDSSRASLMADRNGNAISFGYDSNGRVTSMTDPNGNTTLISYNPATANGDGCTGSTDVISYPGIGGTVHQIVVRFRPLTATADSANGLPTMYRADYASAAPSGGYTYANLLVDSNGTAYVPSGISYPDDWVPASSVFSPCLVSDVTIPNGKRYLFQYSGHGLLARVVLPSGGAYEYDPEIQTETSYENGRAAFVYLKQKVKSKRIYTSSDSSSLESKIDFIDTGSTTTDVKHTMASTGEVLSWTRHTFMARTNGPTLTADFPSWIESRETRVDELDSSGTIVRSTVKEWQQRPIDNTTTFENIAETFGGDSVDSARPHDPRQTSETIIWQDGNIYQKKSYEYDRYNNVTQLRETDFGTGVAGPVLRRTKTDYLYANSRLQSNPVDVKHWRSLPISRQVYDADSAGNLLSSVDFYYDGATESSPTQTIPPTTYSTVTGRHVGTSAPSYTVAGNLTRARTATGSNYLVVSATYDINGNMTSFTDARNATTSYSLDDLNGSCNVGGGNTKAFVTTISRPQLPGLPVLNDSFCWDYYASVVKSQKDMNSQTTTFDYESVSTGLDRLIQRSDPDGGMVQFGYCDTPGANCNVLTGTFNGLGVATRKRLDASRWVLSWAEIDGLGRNTGTRVVATAALGHGDLLTVKSFDGLGRVRTQSVPYYSTESRVDVRTEYDAIGRRTVTRNLGDLSITTQVNQPMETVTKDELRSSNASAGVATRVRTNGLGWVTRVTEDDGGANLVTNYRYDGMGRLLGVCQGYDFAADGSCSNLAGRGRSFTYDLAGRLVTATNPESGTTSYEYDANGNVTKRTFADGKYAFYTYDLWNRLTRKEYSATSDDGQYGRYGLPALYCYDGFIYGGSACAILGVQNGFGRLTDVAMILNQSVFSQTRVYSYDAMGRPLDHRQMTYGQTFAFSYGYDLAGNPVSTTYPSGRTVTMTMDDMGRAQGVSWGAEAWRRATGAKYASHGALKELTLGNNLVEAWTYNGSRRQATGMTVGLSGQAAKLALGWEYCPGGGECSSNNGNILRQTTVTPSMNVADGFTYDRLSRLSTMTETGTVTLSDSYSYDQWGNRWVNVRNGIVTGTGMATQATDYTVKNRLLLAGQLESDYYDAAGNLLRIGGMRLSYDIDGRVRAAANTGYGNVEYWHDGEGRRVAMLLNGALKTIYVYDARGNLVAEYGGGTGSGMETEFTTSDALGSIRMTTGMDGAVKVRRDFAPFGEELAGGDRSAGPPVEPRMKFTGKERDWETGLDYFGARYMSAAQGRFTSPDAPFTDQRPEDPQSWNLYTYVRNNPLAHIDPTGGVCIALNNSSAFCQRATEYGQIHEQVKDKTYFFAAASAVSVAFGTGDMGYGGFLSRTFGPLSKSTQDFVGKVGQDLLQINRGIAGEIQSGKLGGSDLDARIVNREQTKVQGALDSLKKSDPAAYDKLVKESNAGLNPSENLRKAAFGTDKAYLGVLDGVRKNLGRDIDFRKQSDREAIGNALIQHIRKTGGCDVAGAKLKGCK